MSDKILHGLKDALGTFDGIRYKFRYDDSFSSFRAI